MQVLSLESVEQLREAVTDNPKLIEKSYSDLIESLSLREAPLLRLPGSIDFDLIMPGGTAQEQSRDLKNCSLIHEKFSDLTPADATDERLWVTLCFGRFKGYCLARWPLKETDHTPSKGQHIRNHWFASTARGRMRDNCISRLWWMAHIASKVRRWPMEEVLERLFFNSDYRSSLLERHSSANATSVLEGVLLLSKKVTDEGIPYRRECFRDFMKKVDFIGKRTALAALSVDELVNLLEPHYRKSYQMTR